MKYRWSWIVFLAAERRQPLDFSPSLSFLDGKYHICRSVNMLLVFLNQMHVQHCCCWMWVEKKTHSDIKCKQSLLAIRACGRCLYACVCGVRERWINILYYNVNVGACVPKRASMRSKQTSFCEHFHLYIICVRRTRSQYLGMETRSWLCTLYYIICGVIYTLLFFPFLGPRRCCCYRSVSNGFRDEIWLLLCTAGGGTLAAYSSTSPKTRCLVGCTRNGANGHGKLNIHGLGGALAKK